MEILSTLDISVEEGVYRPADDSYLLISIIEPNKGESVLEIGSGTGVISIHCALAGGVVTSCDINDDAAVLTRLNAENNGVELQNVLVSDMFEALEGLWDVIIFNPPYLPDLEYGRSDVRWDGGTRGDETVLRFLEEGWKYMHDDSRLYFCCSDMSPLSAIQQVICQYYKETRKKERGYDFETLYGFELRAKLINNCQR